MYIDIYMYIYIYTHIHYSYMYYHRSWYQQFTTIITHLPEDNASSCGRSLGKLSPYNLRLEQHTRTTMVALITRKLSQSGSRVKLTISDNTTSAKAPDNNCDNFSWLLLRFKTAHTQIAAGIVTEIVAWSGKKVVCQKQWKPCLRIYGNRMRQHCYCYCYCYCYYYY